MKRNKFNLRRAMIFVLTMSIAIACPFTVFAAGNEQSDESLAKEATSMINGQNSITLDNIGEFELNHNFDSAFDTSSFYNAVSCLDETAFGRLSYDIPTSVNCAALLNVEYISLLTEMQNAGWGKVTTLDIPDLISGYAGSITDRFSSIYGDMSDRMELNVSMPDGWTMSEIMAQSSAMRDEMSQDIKNTEIYNTVLSNISTGSVFVSANMTLEKPELKSAVQLNSILNESAAELDAEWDQQKIDGIAQIQKEAADNKSFAEFTSKQDLQDLFDEACGQTDAWLSLAGGQDNLAVKVQCLNKTMGEILTYKTRTKYKDEYDRLVEEGVLEHPDSTVIVDPNVTSPADSIPPSEVDSVVIVKPNK